MKIDLNDKQYKILLKLMYLGEWMVNSHKTKDDIEFKEIDELQQYIFSLSKDFKMERWIDYDEQEGDFYETSDMDEDLQDYIVKYNKRQIESFLE